MILELKKVEGLKNPADLLTKYLLRERVDAFSELIGYECNDGRAKSTVGLNYVARDIGDVEMGEMHRQEGKHWFRLSASHWRANFRGARAHRSPYSAGIRWQDFSRIVTRVSPSGRIMKDIRPNILGIVSIAAISQAVLIWLLMIFSITNRRTR